MERARGYAARLALAERRKHGAAGIKREHCTMIGDRPTDTLPGVHISAVCYEGLAVSVNGVPAGPACHHR